MRLEGYRRNNGRFGVRNHVLFLSTVVCANGVTRKIGSEFPDVVAIEHAKGCVELADDRAITRRMLIALGRNPNVASVVYIGLGCEDSTAEYLKRHLGNEKPAFAVTIQEEGGTTGSLERCRSLAEELLEQAGKERRQEFEVGDLVIGTKCGGTDWTSAIASNAAVGNVADHIVESGGIALLGETVGWFGAEEELLARAKNDQVRSEILGILRKRYDEAERRGSRVEDANPSPGNIAGGVTTLVEKATGNIRKGGHTEIKGVLAIAQSPPGPGLWLMENPGIDPASLAGLAAADAQIILFTTGRGTPVGSPVCPVIKICASPAGNSSMAENIDLDLSDIVMQGASVSSGGNRIIDLMEKVANGLLTKSELLGHREFVMPSVGLL